MNQEVVLEAKNLKKFFPIRSGLLLRHTGDVRAVDDVSFKVHRGETLGLVGESGCGKSTLARTIIKLYEPTGGKIIYKGQDLSGLKNKETLAFRRNMQMIFQDPYASLNPRMTAFKIVSEPFEIHNIGTQQERVNKVESLFQQVGLKRMHFDHYPHEFSGGQRQRLSIARAIALNPEVVVADEAVSALDVSIQAQILNLMVELQDQLKLTFVFVSHNLAVVEHMCNRIAVMYLGRVVELTTREELYNNPLHPYTQALMGAVPIAGRGRREKRSILKGDVPSPINPPAGCHFHPRCEHFKKGHCDAKTPHLKPVKGDENHLVSCFLHE